MCECRPKLCGYSLMGGGGGACAFVKPQTEEEVSRVVACRCSLMSLDQRAGDGQQKSMDSKNFGVN